MKVLRISPIDAFCYEFVQVPSGQYSATKFWYDLAPLDLFMIEGCKIFVEQDRSGKVFSEPNIYCFAIGDYPNLQQARDDLVRKMNNVFAMLSVPFNCAFRIRHEESIISVPSFGYDPLLTHLKIETKDGHLKSFTFLDPSKCEEKNGEISGFGTKCSTYYSELGWVAAEGYLSLFFKLYVSEPHGIHQTFYLHKPENLPPLAPLIKIEKNTIHSTIYTLHSESLAMATPSSAFTLLWKIVEVVERACPSEPLFEDSVLTNIETILKNEIPQVSLDRVVGSLKSMQAASQPARFVKGASHLFPGWEFDEKGGLKGHSRIKKREGQTFPSSR
jgi:hypothetical protein